jgi:hypothetical protein
MMSDLVVIALILTAAIVLDVTAILFGYDSRDGFRVSTTEPRGFL